jgi:hypothetical protein
MSSRPALGPNQPPISWVPGVKEQERESGRSPPTIAEVKKMWILHIHSLIRLHGLVLD